MINLLYSAVVLSKEVITEVYREDHYKNVYNGSCERIAREIASSTLSSGASSRVTVGAGRCQYHCKITDDEYILICAAEKESPNRIAFDFLADVEESLKATRYSVGKMKQILLNKLRFHNSEDNDKALHVQKQIDEVKDVVLDDITLVIDRGEKLEKLEDLSESLLGRSKEFAEKGKELHCELLKQHVKLWIVIIGTVLVVSFIILLIVCGGFSFKKCK